MDHVSRSPRTSATTTDPNNRVPHLAFQADSLSDAPILPIEDVVTGFYLRMHVKDQPGVLAKIAAVFSDADINIEAIIQKDQPDASSPVPLIMIVRQVLESRMNTALDQIRALDVLADDVVRIRLETLDG
ncbi:MAG: ACT domain-containing protein [Ketobacter sp.]